MPCVVDGAGKIIREQRIASEPEALIAWFRGLGFGLERIGLEAGPMSQWLHAAMRAAGLAVELLETRHVRDAFKAMPVKSDRNDARGIAQLMRLGWFRPVHCKSMAAQEMRALLTARKLVQSKLLDVQMSLRGLLRGFGLKVGATTPSRFAGRIRDLVEGNATLEVIAAALLVVHETLRRELAGFEKRVRSIAGSDGRVRLLMSTPGVGAIVALTYVAAIDDPARFKSSLPIRLSPTATSGSSAMLMDVHQRGNLRFPQSLPEFQRLFPDDAACAGYLEKARWSDGFVCPHCQAAGEPFRFANRPGVLRCRRCRRDTPLSSASTGGSSTPSVPCSASRATSPHRPTQSFTPEPGSTLHVGGVGNNRIGEKSSKGVGAHFGLTPKKYQSGETDITGRISKIGDEGVRTALYEAGHIILTQPLKGCTALKSWAMRLAKRAGMKKAKVALARKLAVIMHRMLVDGTLFASAAVAA